MVGRYVCCRRVVCVLSILSKFWVAPGFWWRTFVWVLRRICRCSFDVVLWLGSRLLLYRWVLARGDVVECINRVLPPVPWSYDFVGVFLVLCYICGRLFLIRIGSLKNSNRFFGLDHFPVEYFALFDIYGLWVCVWFGSECRCHVKVSDGLVFLAARLNISFIEAFSVAYASVWAGS